MNRNTGRVNGALRDIASELTNWKPLLQATFLFLRRSLVLARGLQCIRWKKVRTQP